jgi:Tol biopolymer transport system component
VTPKTGPDLKVLRIETSPAGRGAGERPTEPLVQTTFAEDNGEVSPDGRWLAYQSNESGGFQIYVRPFPNTDTGHWQISTIGGTRPLWARSGRELFYLDGSNAMTSVPVHTTPTFSPGIPTTLFGGRYLNGPTGRSYDVSLDGQRFLMIKVKDNAGGDESSASLVVVLNWAEELKRLLPMKK